MGTIYIDDISLHPAPVVGPRMPLPSRTQAAAGRADGATASSISATWPALAEDWLDAVHRRCGRVGAETNRSSGVCNCEGNADDRAGSAGGLVQGRCDFRPGVYGHGHPPGHPGDAGDGPGSRPASLPARATPLNDCVLAEGQRLAASERHESAARTTSMASPIRRDGDPSRLLAANPGQYPLRIAAPLVVRQPPGRTTHRDKSGSGRAAGTHWAFTKDSRLGRMEIYLNGAPVRSRTGANTPITRHHVLLKSAPAGTATMTGLIDDFQIYDYALSPAQIVYVATDGKGVFRRTTTSPADLNADGTVDLTDFALLATNGSPDALWPDPHI